MPKGGSFEREVCKALSLWWTRGERDDVLWRTHGSGARATARAKRGKTTSGQYGDVAATDPIAAPLLSLLTIEVKRGYSTKTIMDCVDRRESGQGSALQCFEQWIVKAIRDYGRAGSYAWILIVRRDYHVGMVYMPLHLAHDLKKFNAYWHPPRPFLTIHAKVRPLNYTVAIAGVPLDWWLKYVDPKKIRLMCKELE